MGSLFDAVRNLLSGIASACSDIIEGIKNLPSLIVDGIKGLFVPDTAVIEAKFTDTMGGLKERLGIDVFDMDSLFRLRLPLMILRHRILLAAFRIRESLLTSHI